MQPHGLRARFFAVVLLPDEFAFTQRPRIHGEIVFAPRYKRVINAAQNGDKVAEYSTDLGSESEN
jgi:hypothetical protein